MPIPWLRSDAVSVHTASTEVEAVMLRGVLEVAGIPVVIRSRQVPGYADAIASAVGVWGEILVPRAYEPEARALLAAYLAAPPVPDPPSPPA